MLSQMLTTSYWVLFKYASLGLVKFQKWDLPLTVTEGLPVICAFWHIQYFFGFVFFLTYVIFPPSVSSHITNIRKLTPKEVARVEGFALKMDHH
jgi:hypothetical protein